MAESAPRVRVIAPARWVPDEVLDQFTEIAGASGLAVEIDPQTRLRSDQLAGDDAQRAAALRAGLVDPAVDILWCARGGYGSARTLPLLGECAVLPSKILIGYSDMCALQLSSAMPGVVHVHGPMLIDAAKPGGVKRLALTAEFVRNLILAGAVPRRNHSLNRVENGVVSASLALSNLAVLTTLLGTPHEPHWDCGVILCLEDISEYLYALDRHLVHLSQSKAGARIVGIVLGDFTDLEDNEVPWGEDIAAMTKRHFPHIPIATGLPMGHGVRNTPLIQGAMAKLLVTDQSASLEIDAYQLIKGAGA